MPSAAAMMVGAEIAGQLLDEGRSVEDVEEEYNVALPAIDTVLIRFSIQLEIGFGYRFGLVLGHSSPPWPLGVLRVQ